MLIRQPKYTNNANASLSACLSVRLIMVHIRNSFGMPGHPMRDFAVRPPGHTFQKKFKSEMLGGAFFQAAFLSIYLAVELLGTWLLVILPSVVLLREYYRTRVRVANIKLPA